MAEAENVKKGEVAEIPVRHSSRVSAPPKRLGFDVEPARGTEANMAIALVPGTVETDDVDDDTIVKTVETDVMTDPEPPLKPDPTKEVVGTPSEGAGPAETRFVLVTKSPHETETPFEDTERSPDVSYDEVLIPKKEKVRETIETEGEEEEFDETEVRSFLSLYSGSLHCHSRK